MERSSKPTILLLTLLLTVGSVIFTHRAFAEMNNKPATIHEGTMVTPASPSGLLKKQSAFLHIKNQLQLSATKLQTLSTRFDLLTPKLATIVSSQSARPQAQKLFADYQKMLADAKYQITSGQSLLYTVTPDGFPENRTVLTTIKTMLIQAKHDMEQMNNDSRKLRVFTKVKK